VDEYEEEGYEHHQPFEREEEDMDESCEQHNQQFSCPEEELKFLKQFVSFSYECMSKLLSKENISGQVKQELSKMVQALSVINGTKLVSGSNTQRSSQEGGCWSPKPRIESKKMEEKDLYASALSGAGKPSMRDTVYSYFDETFDQESKGSSRVPSRRQSIAKGSMGQSKFKFVTDLKKSLRKTKKSLTEARK